MTKSAPEVKRVLWLLVFSSSLCFASAFSAAPLSVVLAPESAVVYEASDERESWQGEAPVERLTLRFDDENVREGMLEIAVEPGRFSSGNLIRDANARRAVFETSEYPEAVFRSERIESHYETLPDGATREMRVVGVLTMHGVSKPVRVPVTVTRKGDTLLATGTFEVLLSDYEMTRPSFLGNTVDDAVRVAFEIGGRLKAVGE